MNGSPAEQGSPAAKESRKVYRRLIRFYAPDLARVLGSLFLLGVSVGVGLLRPWPLAVLVDAVVSHHPIPPWMRRWVDDSSPASLAVGLALATLGLHGLHALLSALQSYTSIQIGLEALARVRTELMSHIQRLSWRFHQRVPIGDLVYRASWDAFAVQTLFQQGFMVAALATVSLGLMVWVMFRMDAAMTWMALGTVPLLLAVIRTLGPPMSQRGRKAQHADSLVSSRVQQWIQALPLIQSYTRETEEDRAFVGVVDQARQRRLSQHGMELVYATAVALVFALGTAAILWVGGDRVASGRVTVGQWLVFLSYLAQFYEPLNQLSHVGATVASASAGLSRVVEVLDEPQELPDPEHPRTLPAWERNQGGWEISFENVSFSYQPSSPVLHALSLWVNPGDIVAVVGSSGAGKSTLLHLIPRFFDPNAGRVCVAGIDVRELRRQDLRERITCVMQEPILLQATIAENISFARRGATREEVVRAAELANAHGFIERLPQQYDTPIGEGAARLSVGEKQRIHLARAFLKQAPILLMDEPTSALDVENEERVLEQLAAWTKGRTVIMVTHRWRTLKIATKVLVMDRGRALEWGSPEELRAAGGAFARMEQNR